MIVEGALTGPGGQLLELGQFLVGLRRAHGFDDVEARQRADAIAALGIAERLVVGELGVAVVLDGLADDLGEAAGGDAVFDDRALGIDQAQRAVGELDRLVFVDQAEVVGREVGEDLDLRLEAVGDLLVGGRARGRCWRRPREAWPESRRAWPGERLGDAAGNDPSGMDALVAEQFDDVLAEAAQADAGAAQFGLGGDDAEDVAGAGSDSMPSSRSGEER
jgi:hypothetical protein